MIVVAGPPGSGKSSVFPVAQTGVDHFNIDDRAAQLNGGSYRNIPPEIRAQSNRECELFIEAHIRG
jgi:dephospho-CoA kinase